MSKLPITEADLHAYVDGLLPEARRVEVEAYVASKPDEAERLRAYREQNDAICAAYQGVLDEPLPRGLLPLAPPARARRWPRYAALVVWALMSGGVGWTLRGEMQSAPSALPAPVASLTRQAAVAHVVYSPDVRRPVEIGADQEDQLVAWLSKRLGTPLKPPKLGGLGYELIGGRLLPGANGPVAQFMYHDVTGRRLTLYVSRELMENKDTAFRFAQEGPVNVFYWLDRTFGYALSAGIDKGELARVATEVYRQVSP
ncbi:MAG: anti-sigma factor family protein [Gammaproteobacteria bacterium]